MNREQRRKVKKAKVLKAEAFDKLTNEEKWSYLSKYLSPAEIQWLKDKEENELS
jgi:hypothetical protein